MKYIKRYWPLLVIWTIVLVAFIIVLWMVRPLIEIRQNLVR